MLHTKSVWADLKKNYIHLKWTSYSPRRYKGFLNTSTANLKFIYFISILIKHILHHIDFYGFPTFPVLYILSQLNNTYFIQKLKMGKSL